MMYLIVASRVDEASMNIMNRLMDDFEFEDAKNLYFYGNTVLKVIDDLHIYHDNIDAEFEDETGEMPEAVIFISMHSSGRAIDTITVHPVGNFGEAMVGGRNSEVIPASAGLMTSTLRNMQETGFRTSFEATHHGPYLESPTFFAEIGSDEGAWMDSEKGEAVARSLMKTLLGGVENDTVAISIGGGHYMPTPTELVKKKKILFGHMIPNYHLRSYEKGVDMILEKDDVHYAYLDRKAIKKEGLERKKIKKVLEDRGIEEMDSGAMVSL